MNPQRALLQLGLAVALAGGAAAAAWHWRESANQQLISTALSEEATHLVTELQDRLQRYEYGLRGLRAMVAANGGRAVSPATLHAYSAARNFQEEFPGALGMSVAWRVPVAEQDAFVRQMRNSGRPEFNVHGAGSNTGDRWLVSNVEPGTRDQSSMGLDLGADAARRTAIAAALASGQATLTAPLQLRTIASGPAVMLILPYRTRASALSGVAPSDTDNSGLVYAPLILNDLLASLKTLRASHSVVQLRDIGEGSTADNLITSSDPEQAVAGAVSVEKRISMYGRTWSARLAPTQALLSSLQLTQPATASALAGLAMAILNVLMHLLIESRRRARQAEAERLRRAAIIESADDAVIAETPDGVVVEWNRAAERMFGYTAKQALGRTIADLILPPDRREEYESQRARILKGTRVAAYDTQRRHADGTLVDVSIAASAIQDAQGRAIGYAKSLRDVRETRRAQAAMAAMNATLETQVAERTAGLEEARQTLRTVLDAMPALIGYWDRGLRNVVGNRAYLDWLGVDPSSLPGQSMADVFGPAIFERLRVRLAQAMVGQAQTFEDVRIPLAQGHGHRDCQVSLVPHLVDGEVRGLFTLFNDISELVSSRAQLAQAQREAAALLQTLHQHAIVSVAGRDGRIIEVNDAFCRISGYERSELIGQDHAIVNSGTHDRTFWHDMWRTLGSRQAWRAEVCNRAKDGTLYWVDSIIAPFHDADGRIERYVSIRHDVTPRKRAQAEAERVRANAEAVSRFLRNLTDRLPLRIAYIDQGKRYRFANQAQCERFGRPREEVLDRTSEELTGQRTPPELARQIASALAGEACNAEYEELGTNGLRTYEVRLVPDYDAQGQIVGCFAVGAEVTERRQQEIERRQALALLHTVLNASTQVSIIATDRRGRVTVFNSGAERLLGYKSADVVGKINVLAFHDADELAARAGGPPALPGHALSAPDKLNIAREYSYVRADGTHVPVSLVVSAMSNEQGEVTGYVGVAHDISERLAQERTLRYAVHEADAANKAKSQFLANMSHEIRTPMNAVIGLIYVLEQGRLDAEQATTLSRIKVASRQLLAIIDDVLDLSKIEAGEMRVEQTSFDLRALVKDVTALMSVQAEAKGIALQVPPAELPLALVGDPTRLRQVLINLLGNAIKFTEHGHVRLEVTPRGHDAQGWTIAFAVEDTGVGISPDALARLFAPFVQADNSTTRRFGGTGLGLSIVRQLEALMGGEVQVQSAQGAGSRFAFELTLPVGTRENVPVVPRISSPAGAGLRGVRVLVVDDNAINQAVAKRVLMLEGATVELADDGQQAVDRLRQAEPEIHIVLMDVQMPVMDGCDATRLIRDELGRTALPILGLTAGVSAEESSRARQAGMDDLVGKPFDPPLLVQRIRQWLEHRQVGPVASEADHPSPPPADDGEWPVVEGLDIPTAQRQLSHSLPLLRELLARFVDRFADLPATPVAQRARRLHDLKGSAASIGARDIAARAVEAERALGHGNDAVNALEQLATMLDRLKASAGSAGLLEPPVTAPAGPNDVPDARTLQDLVQMLRQNDLAALARFQDMVPGLKQRLADTTFRELKTCMDALDFEGAARALDAELEPQPG